MAKFNSLAFAFLFLIFFGSCQSVELISIDYLQPADISFPPQLRKVAIVNNCSTAPDSVLRYGTTPSKKFPAIRGSISYANGDTRLAAESLAEEIANKNYFETVVICDSALRANDIIARENTLSREEVRTLTSNLGADIIIAVEELQFVTGKTVDYMPDYDSYQVALDLKAFPTLKIYIPEREKPLTTLTSSDSIYWEEFGTMKEIEKRMISEKQLLKEAAEFAGTIPIKHIIPYWDKGHRHIYTNGSMQMRDAAVYVHENSWNKAYELWQEVYNRTKRKKKKMKAAMNIAVYYEIKDSLVQAVEWATKAQEFAKKIDKIDKHKDDKDIQLEDIRNFYKTTLYLTELNKRYALLPKINMQMSRFNDDF